MLLKHSPKGQGSGGKRKPWNRTIGKDGKPPSWRPADDARGLCSPEDVEAKTRAKGAVKGSTSLRKMGSSTSLSSSVGLRRPPAFGLPVPLRAQSLGYGSVQRSAFLPLALSAGVPEQESLLRVTGVCYPRGGSEGAKTSTGSPARRPHFVRLVYSGAAFYNIFFIINYRAQVR